MTPNTSGPNVKVDHSHCCAVATLVLCYRCDGALLSEFANKREGVCDAGWLCKDVRKACAVNQ